MSAAIRMRIGYLGQHMRASTGGAVGVAQKGGPSQFRRRERCADDNIIKEWRTSSGRLHRLWRVSSEYAMRRTIRAHTCVVLVPIGDHEDDKGSHTQSRTSEMPSKRTTKFQLPGLAMGSFLSCCYRIRLDFSVYCQRQSASFLTEASMGRFRPRSTSLIAYGPGTIRRKRA